MPLIRSSSNPAKSHSSNLLLQTRKTNLFFSTNPAWCSVAPNTPSSTDTGRQTGSPTAAATPAGEGTRRSHSDGFCHSGAQPQGSEGPSQRRPSPAGTAIARGLAVCAPPGRPHPPGARPRTGASSLSSGPGGRPSRSRSRRGLRGPARSAAAKKRGREAAQGLGPRRCRDRRPSERRPGTATYRGAQGSEAQAQRSALHLRPLLPDPPRPWRGAPKRGRPGRRSETEGKQRRPQAPAPSHRGTGARAGGTRRALLARVIDKARRPLGGREGNVRLGRRRGLLVGRAGSQ